MTVAMERSRLLRPVFDTVFALKGLERIGDPMLGDGPDQFIAPHGIGVDSQGNLYVGEVSYTVWGRSLTPPQTFRCFRKLKKIS